MYENEQFCYEMDKNGVMSMAENGQIKDKRNEEMQVDQIYQNAKSALAYAKIG